MEQGIGFIRKIIAVIMVVVILTIISSFKSCSQTPEATAAERRYPMPWEFGVYAVPSFRAERITNFAPQSVRVLHENGDGWALIYTVYGDYWVYLYERLRYIDRYTRLFENIGDEHHSCTISPQVVKVWEREGNWLLIDTWIGHKWININEPAAW